MKSEAVNMLILSSAYVLKKCSYEYNALLQMLERIDSTIHSLSVSIQTSSLDTDYEDNYHEVIGLIEAVNSKFKQETGLDLGWTNVDEQDTDSYRYESGHAFFLYHEQVYWKTPEALAIEDHWEDETWIEYTS